MPDTTHIVIGDISALAPELDEDQLLMVAGGQKKGWPDMTHDRLPSGCHG